MSRNRNAETVIPAPVFNTAQAKEQAAWTMLAEVEASLNPAQLKADLKNGRNELSFALSRMTGALIELLEAFDTSEGLGIRSLTKEYVEAHNRLGVQFWERWSNACKHASAIVARREGKKSVVITKGKGENEERYTFTPSTLVANWPHAKCALSRVYSAYRAAEAAADPKRADKARRKMIAKALGVSETHEAVDAALALRPQG